MTPRATTPSPARMTPRVATKRGAMPVLRALPSLLLLLPPLAYLAALSPLPICTLASPCPWPLPRPRLPSGAPSTSLWDPIRLHYPAAHPDATPLASSPYLLHFGSILTPREHAALLERAEALQPPDLSDELPVDGKDVLVRTVANRISRAAGLPHADYAEGLVLRRLRPGAQRELRTDWLRTAALALGPFQGCQRVATAMIFLSGSAGGGEVVFVGDRFKGALEDVNVKAPGPVVVVRPVKGEMVVLYHLHPITEREDAASRYGEMPVVEEDLYVASIHLRNCSDLENAHMMSRIMKLERAVPHPSVTVNTSSLDEMDDLYNYDYDDIDDDDLDDGTEGFCEGDDDEVVDLLEFYDDYSGPEGADTMCMTWEDPQYAQLGRKMASPISSDGAEIFVAEKEGSYKDEDDGTYEYDLDDDEFDDAKDHTGAFDDGDADDGEEDDEDYDEEDMYDYEYGDDGDILDP